MHFFALLRFLAFSTATAEYVLQSNFSGATFFDNFNFYDSWDPTFGFVHYVDRATAQAMGLIESSDTGPTIFGVDHTGVYDPVERVSDWNLSSSGLMACSLLIWLICLRLLVELGLLCAANGEIDIIEFPNLVRDNLMALHTSEGCTIAGTGQSGTLLTNDCGAGGGFAGCYTSPKKANSAGTNFNEGGGGVYAMEWTSVAIRIWFFPRGHIPPTVLSSHPDPSKFGVPDANFEGGCDIDKYFRNGTLIFNIEFCGTWAGPTFVSDGCPALNITSQWSSCNMFVAANPDAYKDSYFAVNYVHVYTTTPGSPPPPSSVLSSILPVASTSSATSGGAEGQTTTHTESLAPPTTVPTSTSSTTSSMSTATTTSPPPPPPPSSLSSPTTSAPSPTSSTPPTDPSAQVSDPILSTHAVVITHTITAASVEHMVSPSSGLKASSAFAA